MNAVKHIREPRVDYLTREDPALLSGFDLLATAPKSVAKLRELILSLAVQGKLLPQDSQEEPASASLARIGVAKNRLVAEGQIKQHKAAGAIAKADRSFDLPINWEWARLADLTTILNGRAYAKDELLSEGVPVLRVGNLFTSNHWYYSTLKLEPNKYCDVGDLLFAWSASFGPFIWSGPKAIYHYHIWKLNLHSAFDLNKNYLYTFLLKKTQEIKAAGHGVSMLHMTKEKMEKIVVPIPPLAEQARIVARVEELMQLCDALEAHGRLQDEQHARLVATLFDTLAASDSAHTLAENWQRIATHFDLLLDRPKAVDTLGQTILQLAVRGLIVQQDPGDEPASELLDRIRAEKDRLIAAGQIKRDKPLSSVGDDEKQFEVPRGWMWARINHVSESRLGKMLDKSKNVGKPYPYLRNTNVQWHRIELDDIKEIRLNDHEVAEYRLADGDLLICEGGYPGRCAIWDKPGIEMFFQKALHRVRPLCGVMAKYLEICLRTDSDSGALERYFTGATIRHFAGQELNRYAIPLPPLAEQHRIVAHVEQLRRLCADLREHLNQSRTTQTHLADALVADVIQP